MAKPKSRGNSEGSIYQLKDGRWVAECMIGWRTTIDKKTGELKQTRNIWKVYGKGRTEVKDKLIDMLKARKDGTFVEPNKTTFGVWLDEWMETFKKRKLRPTTYESYEVMIRRHIKPALGHIPLKDLTALQVQKLYNDKEDAGLSARTIRYIHQIIHSALEKARQLKMVPFNVSEGAELPPLNAKQVQALSPDELEKFFRVCKQKTWQRWEPAFTLLVESGMRRGELLALQWPDVDFESKLLSVRQGLTRTRTAGLQIAAPKTETAMRTIPLTPKAEAALRNQKRQQAQEKLLAGAAYQDNNLVFATEHGTPIEPRNLNRAFQRICQGAGIKATLHQLRHTFASRLIQAGADVKTTSEILGHAKSNLTLDTYTHSSLERKREAMRKLCEK
ncbi:MAG: tyrosine-type recombinase/integrase [Bacillota bacterium]